MVKELIAIDRDDRWSRDLARLVRKYRKLGTSDTSVFAGHVLQVRRNRLLWKKMPATVSEAWAVELATPTENLTLTRRP